MNRQLNPDQEMFEENMEEKSVECEIEIKEKVSETLPEYFVCDLCQTCHRTKRGITAHMKKFHFESRKEPEKLYECDICHSKLACKKNLKAHQLTHNNEQRSFKCSHCDAAFKTQTNLHSHEKYFFFFLKIEINAIIFVFLQIRPQTRRKIYLFSLCLHLL